MSDQKTFAYKNPSTGLIEILDAKTGEVIAVQSDLTDLLKDKEDRMHQVQTESGLVWMQKGLSPDNLPTIKKKVWPYSLVLADLICQQIANGKTVTEVCRLPGFPSYTVLCQWRREHDEFRDRLEMAYKDRAENFHDRIIDEIDQITDPDEVPKHKLKIDALKWAAEKGNSERFGTKVQTTTKHEGAVRLVIETGIRRPGDEGFDEKLVAAKDVSETSEVSLESEEHLQLSQGVGDASNGMDTGPAGFEGLFTSASDGTDVPSSGSSRLETDVREAGQPGKSGELHSACGDLSDGVSTEEGGEDPS